MNRIDHVQSWMMFVNSDWYVENHGCSIIYCDDTCDVTISKHMFLLGCG